MGLVKRSARRHPESPQQATAYIRNGRGTQQECKTLQTSCCAAVRSNALYRTVGIQQVTPKPIVRSGAFESKLLKVASVPGSFEALTRGARFQRAVPHQRPIRR